MILSVAMKATLLITLLGLYLVVPEALGLVCEYSRLRNIVTCGSTACSTKSPPFLKGLLPGTYRVGVLRRHERLDTPWFNLYPKKFRGGYWDYHTKSPNHICRGGFGLHPGSRSEGCITVSNDCFNRLKSVITQHRTSTVTVNECNECFLGICWNGTSTISRTLYNSVYVRSKFF